MDTALSLNLSLPAATREPVSPEPATGLGLNELEVVFRREAGGLLRSAQIRLGGDRAAALDLLQQLWVALQRSAGKVPGHQVEFWLRGVLSRLIATHFRREGAKARALAPAFNPVLARQAEQALAHQDGAARLAERAELREQVLLALAELPAADQDVLIAHYIDGRTHAQIASMTGDSVRAVEGRLYRARAALRTRLNDNHEFSGGALP